MNPEHLKLARKALSIRTLTAAQMEDCVPSVAAALEEVERETAKECAVTAEGKPPSERSAYYIGRGDAAAMIRFKFGIAEKETAN